MKERKMPDECRDCEHSEDFPAGSWCEDCCLRCKRQEKEIARLQSEIADRDRRIAEIAVNCPSCGRHDFGLLSGPIEENHKLKAELADMTRQRDTLLARKHKEACPECLAWKYRQGKKDAEDELADLRRKVGEWAERAHCEWYSTAEEMREEAGK